MSTTTIEWTATPLPDGTSLPGYTFNPWIGCTKVSPGCDHCYAENQNGRWNWNAAGWGPHASRRRTSAGYWRQPLKWNREAEASGIRRKVFCASLADVFDNHGSITSGWHGDLWHLIASTPALDWLLLTKRPQNIAKMLPDGYGAPSWGDGWPNVWLGTTAENQEEADRRIPILLNTPAAVRFVSAEPLLGQIDFSSLRKYNPRGEPWINALHGLVTRGQYLARSPSECSFNTSTRVIPPELPGLDWIIAGGESGPGASPMHPDWVRSIRDQCAATGVPFFFKQWGEWAPVYDRDVDDPDWRRCDQIAREHLRGRWLNLAGGHGFHGERVVYVNPVGKKAAGALLDGREHKEWPR